MTADIREMRPDDDEELHRFFAEVPAEDRTFFKEDVTDPALAQRWANDRRAVRRLAVDEDGGILAFAALSPGVERTSHVADLRLVVSARARRQGLGRALARRMILTAVEHGFRKVTVEIAADRHRPIEMFLALGFEPEALLRDQLCDPDGRMHDVIVLAHAVDANWSAMLTGGLGEALR